ncbi:DUF3021 family protein [Streptococcus mitis]|nr:DUF3021 family protein [Streptococcus sp. NLN76]
MPYFSTVCDSLPCTKSKLKDYTSLALLAGWFPLKWQAILLFETIYIFIYILIYFFNYQKMKKEIGLINQNLQQEP